MAVSGQSGSASDESRLRELYRDASTQEPPAHVDAAIRSAAHDAVAKRPPRAAWWVPWRVPFAVAALAVISVSLATLVMEEQGEPTGALSESAPVMARKAEGVPEPMAAPPPRDRKPAVETDRYAPPARAPLATPAERAPAAPPIARQENVAPAAAFPAPAPAPPVAAAPSPLGGAADAGEARASAKPATRESAAVLSAKPAARRADTAQAQSEAAPDIQALKAELEDAPPARWIERILRLRDAGRQADSNALLAEFRRRFPAEPLPTSLQ